MLDGALHVPPYVQLVGLVGADPDPPPLAYDTLNVFDVHFAVNVIVAPLTVVAFAMDAPAAYVLLAQEPLLAVQVHPSKCLPVGAVYVLDGALHVPPYVQLVGLVGADPDPPPLAYDTLNVFDVHFAVNVIVAPSTAVAVEIDAPAAYVLLPQLPVLAVQVHPSKCLPVGAV